MLQNDITLDTSRDSYGRFVQIIDNNLYDGFGQTVSIVGGSQPVLCCDDILSQLDEIESKIEPQIVYRDRVITNYVEVQTVKYVSVPCDKPKPPDKVVRQPPSSNNPTYVNLGGWVDIGNNHYKKGPNEYGYTYYKSGLNGKIYRESEWNNLMKPIDHHMSTGGVIKNKCSTFYK